MTTVFAGKLITVVVQDGQEIVRHPDAVAIVAVDADDNVVFVRQERAPVGRKLLELPAGKIDPGESPLECGRRELQEETGLRGGDWIELGTIFTSPGFTDEVMHLFAATGVEEGDASPEEDEELELVRVPAGELRGLVSEIEDGKTLAGLLLYLRLEDGDG
jgi:ADP-ribose diphosphatase